jgi:hypothetical protein
MKANSLVVHQFVLLMPILARAVTANGQVGSPAEQYQALLRDYQDAAQTYSKASAAAKNDEERKKLIRPWDLFAPKFLNLAERNIRKPAALDALLWVVENTADASEQKDSPRAKAIAHLLRHHSQSEKLGAVCPRLAAGFAKESEMFLRTVLEKNPHKEVQGLACLALAQFRSGQLHRLDNLKDEPDLGKLYEDQWGKDYSDELRRQDRAKFAKEIETLLERAAEKYGDVKGPFPWTIRAKANAELWEIRNLSVGKEAPDIEDIDQDGKKLKLSDFRGKVTLLDFRSQY